jgi:hypothetical protein
MFKILLTLLGTSLVSLAFRSDVPSRSRSPSILRLSTSTAVTSVDGKPEAKVIVVLEEGMFSQFKWKPRLEPVHMKEIFIHIKEKLTWDKEGLAFV